MISAEMAYNKANEFISDWNMIVISGVELSDSYAFMTNYKGEEDIYPGAPIIQVMKDSGEVSLFDKSFKNDPFEKIDMLIAAPDIDISSFGRG